MHKLMASVVCSALVALACDGGGRPAIPTGPGQGSSPSPLPSPPPFSFAEPYTQITIGEVVSRHVTGDSPPCVGYPEWRCRYFRLIVPRDGTFDAVMTSSLATATQVVDLSVSDSAGTEWWDPAPRVDVLVSAPVKAGATYQMTVWYVSPGVEFELRTSLR